MKKKQKTLIILIFVLFFLLLLFQYHFVWLYHDDYGYASLSYIGNIDTIHRLGYHTKIIDIIKFCMVHYQQWGGRLLLVFTECIVHHFGVHGVRIFQSISLLIVFYYIYKILAHILKKDDYKLALLVVSLYGIFDLITFRDGITWFAAFINYIFPLIPFLIFIYRYVLKEKNKTIWDTILATILVFLASFSQEQVSAMVVGFIIVYEFDKIMKNETFEIKELPIIIAALCGFGLLLFCPGNLVRMNLNPKFYRLPFYRRFLKARETLYLVLFGYHTRVFTLLFFSIVAYISFVNNKAKKSVLNIIALLSNLTILVVSVVSKDSYFSYLLELDFSFIYTTSMTELFTFQLLLTGYSIVTYLLSKKQKFLIELLIGIVCSQLPLLMAPTYAIRCVLPTHIMLFIIIVYVLHDIYKKHGYLFLIPLIVMFNINLLSITTGYIKNDEQNAFNHKTLVTVSNQIKNGEKVETVFLKTLKDPAYASCMPYQTSYDYIYHYIKSYYQLPDDIKIIYK